MPTVCDVVSLIMPIPAKDLVLTIFLARLSEVPLLGSAAFHPKARRLKKVQRERVHGALTLRAPANRTRFALGADPRSRPAAEYGDSERQPRCRRASRERGMESCARGPLGPVEPGGNAG